MPINQATILNSENLRPTHVKVNLTHLCNNLKAIRERVAPAKVMIVIKANAYGHGMDEVARHLAPHADYLGVAVLEEGILLREMEIDTPILVLGGIWEEQIPDFIKHDLTLTASSVERLQQIDQVAEALKKKATVHLKIDTGMERIGVHYYSAEDLQEAALNCKHVDVEGIYSHFANADAADLTHARLQLARFNEVLSFYEKRGIPTPRLRHMANSGAILQLPEANFDMVRPGILLYGVYPSDEVERTVHVTPALSWSSKVVYFKVTKPEHPVSYGSTWQSDVNTRVATVPVGYGDGYFRAMSNQAQVIIRGVKLPQVGRICMDQMVVNLGADGTGYNGDEVVLIGKQRDERITAEDLARWAGTIPYEILTNINTRVPRVYITSEPSNV
jgi:alanine racemase